MIRRVTEAPCSSEPRRVAAVPTQDDTGAASERAVGDDEHAHGQRSRRVAHQALPQRRSARFTVVRHRPPTSRGRRHHSTQPQRRRRPRAPRRRLLRRDDLRKRRAPRSTSILTANAPDCRAAPAPHRAAPGPARDPGQISATPAPGRDADGRKAHEVFLPGPVDGLLDVGWRRSITRKPIEAPPSVASSAAHDRPTRRRCRPAKTRPRRCSRRGAGRRYRPLSVRPETLSWFLGPRCAQAAQDRHQEHRVTRPEARPRADLTSSPPDARDGRGASRHATGRRAQGDFALLSVAWNADAFIGCAYLHPAEIDPHSSVPSSSRRQTSCIRAWPRAAASWPGHENGHLYGAIAKRGR